MRWLLMAVLLVACNGSPATPEVQADPEAEYGGNPLIYDRILGLSDCDELQAEFEIAADMNDHAEPGTPAHRQSLGYMKAANDRIEELC